MRIHNITSQNNENFKNLKKLSIKKYREENGLFLIEGEHLLEEALKTHNKIKSLLIKEKHQDKYNYIDAIDSLKDIKTYILSDSLFDKLMSTKTPQGVAAILQKVELVIDSLPVTDGLYLVIDGIQDPGNLGTIIRTAHAFNVKAIFLTPETVDLFNPKVINSTAGSMFHIPIMIETVDNIFNFLTQHQIIPIQTKIEDSVSTINFKFPEKSAIILGNEGAGVSTLMKNYTNASLSIPMVKSIDSLNVAVSTAIILYEHYRQNS